MNNEKENAMHVYIYESEDLKEFQRDLDDAIKSAQKDNRSTPSVIAVGEDYDVKKYSGTEALEKINFNALKKAVLMTFDR